MKGIPIKEFAAQSPENAKVIDDLMGGLKSGTISMCACLGAMYGEPHCPCKMKALGLPLNEKARAIEDARSKKQWAAMFERGGIFHKDQE